MFTRLKQALLKRAEKHRENLTIFIVGAGIFFFGMMLIFFMDSQAPSLRQEVAVIVGLALVVIGGVIAAFGYVCLSFLRLYSWLNKD